MSSIRLCKGVVCLKENDFGLPRDKGSFRPGSKVCDRCEDEADRIAGVRQVRIPASASLMAPPAQQPAAEVLAHGAQLLVCKRCNKPKLQEELNKDGGCKPCKRKSNQADRARRLARLAEKTGEPSSPAIKPPENAEPSASAAPPPPARLMEVIVGDMNDIDESHVREIEELRAKLGRAQHALQVAETREREQTRKVLALEHALSAARVMYEALEDRFRRHVPEAHQ